eukprot:1545874-Prymnesium_polylepis.2
MPGSEARGASGAHWTTTVRREGCDDILRAWRGISLRDGSPETACHKRGLSGGLPHPRQAGMRVQARVDVGRNA